MCHEMGIETGIDLDALIEAAWLAEDVVGHPLPGSVMKGGTLANIGRRGAPRGRPVTRAKMGGHEGRPYASSRIFQMPFVVTTVRLPTNILACMNTTERVTRTTSG